MPPLQAHHNYQQLQTDSCRQDVKREGSGIDIMLGVFAIVSFARAFGKIFKGKTNFKWLKHASSS